MYSAKEQKEFAKKRTAAIMNSGYKFIELRLLDANMKKVAGIHELNAIPYQDQRLGEQFSFVTVGGHAHFSPNDAMGGQWIDWWLDDDHNRDFLASHWKDDVTQRYWEIKDKDVEKDIIKRHSKMAQVSTKVPVEIEEIRGQIKEVENRLLTCDKREEAILRNKRNQLLDRAMEMVTGEAVDTKVEPKVEVGKNVNIGARVKQP